MQAPRLNEVLSRVVAWHNRHPLARRISASQVHSIGEVVLPFASAQPVAAPAAPPPHLPTIAELLAAEALSPEVAAFDELVRRAAHPPPESGPPAPPPPADDGPETADDLLAIPPPSADDDRAPAGAADDDDGEAALEMPLLAAGDDAPADADADANAAAAAAQADDDGADVAVADEPAESLAPEARPTHTPDAAAAAPAPAALHAAEHAHAPAAAEAAAAATHPAEASAAATVATPALAPPPAGSRWQRLLARLPGRGARRLPRLQPAFSLNFIWPLSPGQVGRWARRHGQLQPVAPADWPRRTVDTDTARQAGLRRQGLAHAAPLHVLTAAIGVGDRRIRVLMGADGAVLGPRAYSPPRVAAAALLLALGVAGATSPLWRPAAHPAAAPAAAEAPTAASAPLPAASAADAPHDAASAATDGASQAAQAADPASAATGPAGGPHGGAVAHAAEAPASALPTDAAASAAPAAEPRDIRPQLSAEERQAARIQSAALRGEPPPAPAQAAAPAPVFAVVSPPQRQRDVAVRALAVMQAAAGRMPPPVPEHGELMHNRGEWQAAWWPFTSLADAERARVLLAGRGLKAEVVEF